uniref:Uncharacterized protein n=1 Tax=Arundo donax TaxID=35708 RepID=A0A0A9G145_ARUDO
MNIYSKDITSLFLKTLNRINHMGNFQVGNNVQEETW